VSDRELAGGDANEDILAMELDAESVTLPRGVLKALLDTAVTSMDFGSGFLNDVDVLAMRTVAVAVGVDPVLVTPSTHACKFKGHHEMQTNVAWFHDVGSGSRPGNRGPSVSFLGRYRYCPLCGVVEDPVRLTDAEAAQWPGLR